MYPFAEKNMNEKIFEKINLKVVISRYSVTLYQISVNLENLRFINIKIEISI